MKPTEPRDIRRLFAEGTEIDAALRRAVVAAIERHRREGRPIAVWKDGRATTIPATDPPLPPLPKAG